MRMVCMAPNLMGHRWRLGGSSTKRIHFLVVPYVHAILNLVISPHFDKQTHIDLMVDGII